MEDFPPSFFTSLFQARFGKKEFQGKGFGGIILADAIKRIMNNELNPAGVIVDMKATELFHFYKKFGFIRLESNPLQCILVFSKLKRLPE